MIFIRGYIYIFFTKALYKEYLMKSKESKPDLSCVFCDDPVKTKDLIEHISDKHIEEVCSFTIQIMTEYPSYWSVLVADLSFCFLKCHILEMVFSYWYLYFLFYDHIIWLLTRDHEAYFFSAIMSRMKILKNQQKRSFFKLHFLCKWHQNNCFAIPGF